MRSERVNGMFQKHLKPEESLLYADFLNDLCKLIVSTLLHSAYCALYMHFYYSTFIHTRYVSRVFGHISVVYIQ